MTAFDHRDRGTPPPAWSTLLEALPVLDAPGADDHVVVLAAHPDDETLGAGGLIAQAAADGARITVVVASDGAASHPTSPTHSPARLAALRRDEVRAAVRTLAPNATLHLLDLPDGALADHEAAVKDALAALDPPTLLVTPWAGDRHPDHEACARVGASLGVRQWQYPIWAWHWGSPAEPPPALHRLPLSPTARSAKGRALDCHVSQHSALSAAPGDEALLGSHLLPHFQRPDEAFVAEPISFDALYAASDDPWGLADRFYEKRKRDLLLAALPRPRFRRAFEPGCATGLLTAGLAQRCDEVVAWDVADSAVESSGRLLDGLPNVRIDNGCVPRHWPDGAFDLLVLSEIAYYCTDLAALRARIESSLAVDGVLVACHWRHPAPMHAHSAEAAHEALGHGLQLVVAHVEADFLLHVWSRDGVSVAAAEGIVR